MSKRRKKKSQAAVAAVFKIGDRVRVRPGVWDVEHPDFPLGGCVGVITEINRYAVCCVRWSEETLKQLPAICRKRAAIDGVILEEYYLGQEDLMPDDGGPVSIEQPMKITPRPLSEKEQGDRLRIVFGLTTDDYLPRVDGESLETYYDYLDRNLRMPIEAREYPNLTDVYSGRVPRIVQIVALDKETAWTEPEGILCTIQSTGGEEAVPLAELEVRRNDANFRTVKDYAAWFAGEYEEDDDDEDAPDDIDGDEAEDSLEIEAPEAMWSVLDVTRYAVTYGAFIGAAVAVMPWARWTAGVLGAAGGLIVLGLAARDRECSPVLASHWIDRLIRLAVSFVDGAVDGVIFGIIAVGFVGALLGAIVYYALKRFFRGKDWPVRKLLPKRPIFGLACGAALQAVYLDRSAALIGLAWGAGIGLAGAALSAAIVFLLLMLFLPRK